ncbi:MAG: hypothetical protein Q4Q03_03485 [Bowdeniella nasicola]|nr:hypothetical protein [Bowdeniella nasicola]
MAMLWEPIALHAGDYHATIDPTGASLAKLTYRDMNLVRHYSPHQVRPDYAGATLAPWPNRIVDGIWDDDRTRRQLPITEVARNHALHGLVSETVFELRAHTARHARLATTIAARAGYPYRVDLTVTFDLDARGGLNWQVRATSRSDGAPIGLGIHPYLCVAGSGVDDWHLRANTARMLTTSGPRLLPGEDIALPPAWDFTAMKPLANQQLDHAFRLGGPAAVELHASSAAPGDISALRVSSNGTWLQIYTCDAPGPAQRRYIAIEPQTCAPNAFNALHDPQLGVERVNAGDTRELRTTITAVCAG